MPLRSNPSTALPRLSSCFTTGTTGITTTTITTTTGRPKCLPQFRRVTNSNKKVAKRFHMFFSLSQETTAPPPCPT